ncbi:hypothetical protein CsSME_00032881 [Camellia sinensis var. sinensis]
MDRSPRLAFATAPVGSLNQATAYESPAHSSTGTRSEPRAPPTAWELTVSCSISLPDGGSFHPSLTPCKVVLADSHGIPRVPCYSGQSQHDACIALPQPRFHGLGCSHFARRYYGNRFCFLFLWLLRCFSSPGCLLSAHGFSSSSKG